MGCWLGIFKATALVDGNVNQNGSWLHFLYQCVGDKLWSLCSRDQNGTNN
jgi:hypothetical protein